MAIKALKQSVSISETQKMIHQWKGRGINDPTITKLLDLYLGMPAYMNSQGIYPHCNFYDIRLSLRFSYTSTLVAAVTNCLSFGMIWDEPHTKVIAFYSPLWYRQENGNPTESPQNPAQETPQDSAFNSNILYNINNIYPPEDSRKGYSAGNGVRNTEETDSRKTPSEIPAETPDGGKTSPALSPATDFFHRLNASPEEKQRVLVPLINSIATSHHYTRPRRYKDWLSW